MSVLLIEFNDTYFRDVALQLLRKKVKISHICTLFPELYRADSTFSKVNLLDERHFHLADYIPQLNKQTKNSLSKELIINNLELESLYLSITDRISFYPKTVIERKQRYFDLLLYWDSFLRDNGITTVIFPRVPHLGYGNIIYYLAKSMKLTVVLVRETLLDDRVLLTSGYNDFKKVPPTFLRNLKLKTLEKKLHDETEIQLNTKTQLMQINTSDNTIAAHQNKQGLLSGILDITTIKAAVSLFHNPFDRFIGTPTFMELPTTWWDYYKMMFWYYLRYRQVFGFYTTVSHEVDLKKKYIYLALHYQPERTSLPEGDVFENQLLMIDILAKSIPKEWLLYVKEHPFQFTRTDIRKMNFRTPAYYKRIMDYPNIRLVSLTVNSQQLLDNCQAAVTLTGSTGWEALTKGKPVITFSSSAWYSPCTSCYVVTSQAECKAAITKLKTASPQSVRENLLKYLLFFNKKFITAASSVELAAISKKPYHKLVKNLALAISQRL